MILEGGTSIEIVSEPYRIEKDVVVVVVSYRRAQ
jgi:hypothetical protein